MVFQKAYIGIPVVLKERLEDVCKNKMSFQSQIESFSKNRLKNVETTITTAQGKKLVECTKDGQRVTVDTGLTSLGFCEDTNPDTKIYRVVDKLYISSQDGAWNRNELEALEITHILNVATGVDNPYSEDFTYKNVELLDLPETKIQPHFKEMFDFINKGCEHGSVLVHCNAGISRSATVIVAFLMHKLHLSLDDSLKMVRDARPSVKPNEGFMRQLKEYEQYLGLSKSMK